MISALRPVAPAQPADLELGGAAGDLEGEQVLPLGPRRVQPGIGAGLGPQVQERVVLHLHRPVRGRQRGVAQRDRSEEELGQVDEVDALVEQLPASGSLRGRPATLLVAQPTAVAVARPHQEGLRRTDHRRRRGALPTTAGWKRWLNPTRTTRPCARATWASVPDLHRRCVHPASPPGRGTPTRPHGSQARPSSSCVVATIARPPPARSNASSAVGQTTGEPGSDGGKMARLGWRQGRARRPPGRAPPRRGLASRRSARSR